MFQDFEVDDILSKISEDIETAKTVLKTNKNHNFDIKIDAKISLFLLLLYKILYIIQNLSFAGHDSNCALSVSVFCWYFFANIWLNVFFHFCYTDIEAGEGNTGNFVLFSFCLRFYSTS